MDVFAFVDSNPLLHYRDLDEIDWRKELDADQVFLILAPIVVRELDTKKNDPNSKVRKRASAVIAKLFQLSAAGHRVKLREGVELQFHAVEPGIDFGSHQLDPQWNDDRLIAAALECKEKNPGSRVVIVSADMGLTLKARHHQVDPVQLPDSLKLPEEVDPNAKLVQELKKELLEAKRAIPELKLQFKGGADFQLFNLHPPVPVSRDDIERERKLVRLKFKKWDPEKGPAELNPYAMMAPFHGLFNKFSKGAIERYNSSLDDFFHEFDEWIALKPILENLDRRTIILQLELANLGNAPAGDIDLFFHFPSGFKLYDDGSLPEHPQEPRPPKEPSPYSPFPGFFEDRVLPSNFQFPPFPVISPKSHNVSSPTIKPGNSYDVEFHIQKVKHGLPEELDPLYVVFETFERAFSFGIDYRILAGNVPKEIQGTLNVVVEKLSL